MGGGGGVLVYWFHIVRLSVSLLTGSCPLCIFHNTSRIHNPYHIYTTPSNAYVPSLIARFMGPSLGPYGADRTQVVRMLAPWTLLSGLCTRNGIKDEYHFTLISPLYNDIRRNLIPSYNRFNPSVFKFTKPINFAQYDIIKSLAKYVLKHSYRELFFPPTIANNAIHPYFYCCVIISFRSSDAYMLQ